VSAGTARGLVVAYIIVIACLLMYPGILPFNRVEPRVLGLPFVIFWVAFCVMLGFVVLVIMDSSLTHEEENDSEEDRWNAGS
jgi:hypothetical protein